MSDNRLRNGDDLAAMFGIEFDPDASLDALQDTGTTAAYAATLCAKCNGRGKFVSYTGRVVGDCFSCNGTGLARSFGVTAQPGDCDKCLGSGEWRPGRQCFACNGTGKDRAVSDAAISVEPIARAFASAHAAGVKTPRLRLGSFVFSRAPDHGKNAGAIYVKRSGEYLGKVTDGRFRPVMSCDAGTAAEVVEVAANPHEAALAYGADTKRCSCCGLTLTNEESKRLGIGPICRAKYGWG
jgi:hypothetical protein